MPRRTPVPAPEPPRRRRGTGTVTRLAQGMWRSRLPRQPDGSRPAHDCPTRAEAEAWLGAMLAPPTPAVAVPLDVETWTGTWYEDYVEPMRTPNTARWALYALRFLAPLYPVPLAALKPSQLQKIIGELTQRLAAETVQGIAGMWRRCFEAALDDGHIERNPAKRLTLPKSSPRVVKRHVTAAEVALIWPKIVGHRFEAAFALLLGCGLRIGEVLGITWEAVDFRKHRVWIGPQWTNSHWRPEPKGRNPHWASLPPAVEAALIRHRDRQEAGAIYVMQSPHTTWFGRGKDTRRKPEIRPWSAHAVRADLSAIVTELGLDEMTPHAARRGLVSALLDGGVSPAVVAEIAGHADQATTLRSYAARNADAREHAAEVVDRYLGAAPGADAGADTA